MAKKYTGLKKINSSYEHIFSIEEFRSLITYERTRSDRNGSIFSIVVLDSSKTESKYVKDIFGIISKCARSIDCIGWFEHNCLAILLPDTGRKGAVVFRNKLLSELAVKNKNLATDIYTYPESWLSNCYESKNILDCEDGNKKFIEQMFVHKLPLWKRLTDIIVSTLIIVTVFPILFLTALYIKLVSPGPIFFSQKRIGYKGKPFTFWKFRTMKFDNNQSFHGKHAQSFIKDGDVPMEKLDTIDPRIFFGGKVLRKSCIDELPQLWNVLKGDMSLVGPRPCIPYEAEEYLRWHTHRFDTVPGLSGLWQVSGKNKLTFKQMIRLDITYCNNMSFWGDLIIILRTPFAILKMIMEAVINKIDKEVADTNIMIDHSTTPKRKAQ